MPKPIDSEWFDRKAHCGVCHEIQFAALHVLADIHAEHPDWFDNDILGELAELTSEQRIVEFVELMGTLIEIFKGKPDMEKKVHELENKNEILTDIAKKLESGEMEMVDPPQHVKAALKAFSSFPQHPDTVVVAPNEFYPQGLTEQSVWQYYDSVKDKLVKELAGHDVMLVIATPRGTVIRRNDYKTKRPIRIDTVADFDRLNSGRVIEWHSAI